MQAFEFLTIEDRGPVRIVKLNRPQVLNALNSALIEELLAAIEASSREADVRGLVLSGTGRAFAAGADIRPMRDLTPDLALALAIKGQALGEALQRTPWVTIAAVEGVALGGGCELALACDFIYASPTAKFGQPEVKLGVIPGFGGTQRLLRRVGLPRALELCMTGQTIDAVEALRIGLVNRIVPADDLLAAAIQTVELVASRGPLAVAKVKEVLYRGADMTLAEGNRCEREAFASLFATADQREGMTAFLDKRPAEFHSK